MSKNRQFLVYVIIQPHVTTEAGADHDKAGRENERVYVLYE